ncbi:MULTISPECIES: AfsR/SARP family transcriptional regulator [Nocardiopsis]|uniref:AfsR/SARP family transcriptional regulator n=1 Tax=Nocardiopsis TaxID=2013 RepID=UPI002DBB4F68|nr:BTAD domain-containing putative transcriptional regulator [Nocardiopsis sp. LDBS1602]MEC3895802.1 BTAD domain-containing putative transcriptional regulator [Nocardiopsis sp. LDBS1602]
MGGPRQRCVLGALLVHVGREVTIDQLTGYLWNEDPPRTARSVIQVQVSHLRRLLPGRIATTSGGYVLEVDPESVDLHRFRRLRDEAARADSAEAIEFLDLALKCWRGIPFSGVGSDYLDDSVVRPIREERWSAVISWASHALELERHSDVVARLTSLSSEEPFSERLHEFLITALWKASGRAKALSVYEDFRRRLADELGVDPGHELLSLHSRILHEDVSPQGDVDPVEESVPDFRIRNDLPRDLPDFTGRGEALKNLEDFSLGDDGRAKICVITDSGGAGKTTTAVHFGYEIADRYPDGQIFIDLYGYTSNKEPLDPASALGSLLRAVGIEPETVPESLAERSALWRATLRGRRVLLILDNAFSHAQVSPLLPSSSGTLTLITTRNELVGLSGARFLSLGMFDDDSSLELLRLILGDARVDSELEGAREVARFCGGLPLALRVIAGRMAGRPKWTFAHVIRRLVEQNRTFRELAVEGQSVEVAIDLSFQSLNPTQRRAFLLLGLMVGNVIELSGAAALFDTSVEDADDTLQELVGVCLLEEPQEDVYRAHDLIRAFALDRALAEFGHEEADRIKVRLSGFYLETAQRAAELLGPRVQERSEVSFSRYRVELSSRREAEDWFSLHQENLADAIEYFASRDHGEEAWRLADAVWRFYAVRGQMGLLVTSHERVLQISERQGNRRGRAVTLIGLGIAYYISGRFEESLRLLGEARTILEGLGDGRGVIRALANLGMVYERMGRFADSAAAIKEVLRYAEELRNPKVEALQWGNLAVLQQSLGEYKEALASAERAILISQGEQEGEIRARAKRVMGEAHTCLGNMDSAFQELDEAMELSSHLQLVGNRIYVHNSRGIAHRAAGRFDEAVREHGRALALAETSGDRSGDAEILTDLGVTQVEAARYEEAREGLDRALELAVERGERYIEARASLALGGIPGPFVDPGRARDLLAESVRIFEDLDLPEAEAARRRLQTLDAEPGPDVAPAF